jgi:hypothetical protein
MWAFSKRKRVLAAPPAGAVAGQTIVRRFYHFRASGFSRILTDKKTTQTPQLGHPFEFLKIC